MVNARAACGSTSPGASWIWATKDWSPSRLETTFTQTFRANAGPGTLKMSADNEFVATLNGTQVAHGTDWAQIFQATVQLRQGDNTLIVTATNQTKGSADPYQNPAGAVWTVEGSPETNTVTANAGDDQTVPEAALCD